MNCKNCYIPNRDVEDMDIDRMIDCISRFPKRTMIRIIGAEPTMRNDLHEIIARIRATGNRCTLLSNGLKLASNRYVARLKEARLSHVYISLNGVDNDDWYEEIDELRCSKVKIMALKNIHANKFVLDTGTIIVKGVNDEAPSRMLSLLQREGIDHAVCRFKNVGQLGRYMKECDENYTQEQMIKLLSTQVGVSEDYIYEWKHKPIYQNDHVEDCAFMFPLNPNSAGKRLHRSGIWIKVADWDTTDKPTAFPNQKRRGRITEDFKIAPFFEHVKLNEGGY
tara:strand:- start:959 stop:1798 length:840 start_codon:yes stop_codon:yes gene_type:complete